MGGSHGTQGNLIITGEYGIDIGHLIDQGVQSMFSSGGCPFPFNHLKETLSTPASSIAAFQPAKRSRASDHVNGPVMMPILFRP